MGFKADWLVASPLSFEKRIVNNKKGSFNTKIWTGRELPTLYTPVNSAEILAQKRLTV